MVDYRVGCWSDEATAEAWLNEMHAEGYRLVSMSATPQVLSQDGGDFLVKSVVWMVVGRGDAGQQVVVVGGLPPAGNI